MTFAAKLEAVSPPLLHSLIYHNYSKHYLLGIMDKERLSEQDFFALLSPSAEALLPEMAQRAQAITRSNFGLVKQIYAPLYLSNACINQCVYCGFQASLNVAPIILTQEERVQNYDYLAKQGFGHILLLTGEAPHLAGVGYIVDAIKEAKKYFPSVSLEVFPVSTEDYSTYVNAGVHGVTLYQETYNPTVYRLLHTKGPKANYLYRLNAPERALLGGVRQLGLGALLGLADWREDGAYLGLHTHYLQQTFWQSTLSVSFPRIQPLQSAKHPILPVSDKALVQLICALRLFLPQTGFTLSTRESASLRNKLIHIGITHISAGSNTHPGGYTRSTTNDPGQFEIQDDRSLADVLIMLNNEGFDPVLKDWSNAFTSAQ